MANYRGDQGRINLRRDFANRAPVWSIFWHHILHKTPIFDVYTHMAWHWDVTGVILPKDQCRLHAPDHWSLYDRYTVWFQNKLHSLHQQDADITERKLDRALVMWGGSDQKDQHP